MKRPQIKLPDLTRLKGKLPKPGGGPKLKRPQLKAPRVKGAKGPGIKRPQLKGPDVNVPEPLRELYRDLRERHLLVVVVALLAAIVAVPLLVRSDAEPAPAPAPVVDVEEGLPLDPAVVASNPGLRDFHERLDHLRARNPFKQQLVPSDSEVKDSNLTREGNGGDDGTTDAGATGTGTDAGTGTDTGAGIPDTGTGDTGTDAGGDDAGDDKPESVILEPRIDVKVGRAGATKVREGVAMLALLPSDDDPVLQYAGSDRNGKGASFVVSRDVVSVSGEGVCKPRPGDCRFLHLKVGQRKKLVVSSGATYSIKLLKVTIERVPASAQGAKEAGAGKEQTSAELSAGSERATDKAKRPAAEHGDAPRRGPSPGLVAEPLG